MWVRKGSSLLVVYQLIGSYPGATAGCGRREENLEPLRLVTFTSPPSFSIADTGQLFSQEFFGKGYFL